MRVVVVGGGAAGMLCTLLLAKDNIDVVLLEKNEKLGKKLYITGKGRCNLTNLCPPDEFLQNVVRGEKFMRSAIYAFNSENTVEFFNSIGLDTVVERGNRVFPFSQKSSDVIKVLQHNLISNGVQIRLNTPVKSIKQANGSYEVVTPWEKFQCDKVVVATGGVSYPSTGSTGDGYVFAQQYGCKIVEVKQALTSILTQENVSELNGISLKNVTLTAYGQNGKLIKSEFGELLFTLRGLSGPIALTISSFINRSDKIDLSIDLKPALDVQTLEKRILRDFDERSNQDLKNVTRALLPEKLNMYVLKKAKLDPYKKVNVVTKEERQRLVEAVKNLKFQMKALAPFEESIITSGGVDLSSVKPTMECKTAQGLYFIGEVLDVDALTGGFNLQIAFSTAYKAAQDIKKIDGLY